MSHYFSIRDLGLTLEEAQALRDCAIERQPEVLKLIGEYAISEEERTMKALRSAADANKIPHEKVGELLAIRNFSRDKLTAKHMTPLIFEAKFNSEHGVFTEHESFGCMSNHSSTSTHPTFVGTPTLDSSMVNLRFHRAQLSCDRFAREEPSMDSTRALGEFDLSADQFAGLMRERNSGSPCAIGRDGLKLLDAPPRMISSVTIAAETKLKAKAIVAPLMQACKTMREHLAGAAKISTKADYALLIQHAQNVQEAMDLVRPPLRALLAETAGLLAESSTKQLMSEIAEPLKALGMDATEVLRLMNH